MEIGLKIKALRIEKGKRQEELADYLGVSFQAVSKWETLSSTPDISLLPKLAVYFGITIDELFTLPISDELERIENSLYQERRIAPENFDHSVNFLEGILKENPKDIRALSDLAFLYNHRAHSDHEMASNYAEKVLELDPEKKCGWIAYLEANDGLCGDQWYDNHFELIRYLKSFLDKNPKNFRGLYAIIENMLTDHCYDAAIPYIEQIKDIKPERKYMYDIYMGDVEAGHGNFDKAIYYWNRAVTVNPNVWQAYCCRGDRMMRLGKYSEALKDYEYSYEMQNVPHIVDGLYSMEQIYELQGDFDKAIECYERILACLKDDYSTNTGEGVDRPKREIERLIKAKGV
ncbi:MAG: hypothetical protein K0S47_3096 [Herbinix sp.]|jgi:transcriptional regulator with XRE-family HTH domain|nr:hypothetical protein [Herbinix sp.]